jgi:hypothetical protein
MSQFNVYFELGMSHIIDIEGLDHILFVIVLSAMYLPRDWKHVIILVTAFTIGHSITLALATFDYINVNEELIEFLIPVTIFITAVTNLVRNNHSFYKKGLQINYLYALMFGLIHGLGFSNYLKSLFGKSQSVVMPLFAFNVGIEVGQILIVGAYLLLASLMINVLGTQRRDWGMIVSAAVAGMAILFMLETKFW